MYMYKFKLEKNTGSPLIKNLIRSLRSLASQKVFNLENTMFGLKT